MTPLGKTARRWIVAMVLVAVSVVWGLLWAFRHTRSAAPPEAESDDTNQHDMENDPPPSSEARRGLSPRPVVERSPRPSPSPPGLPASPSPARVESKIKSLEDRSQRSLRNEEPTAPHRSLIEHVRIIKGAIGEGFPADPAP